MNFPRVAGDDLELMSHPLSPTIPNFLFSGGDQKPRVLYMPVKSSTNRDTSPARNRYVIIGAVGTYLSSPTWETEAGGSLQFQG